METLNKKTEELFQFYLNSGFNHTIDEILTGLSISRKTFFNRYGSKKESVEMCITFWHEKVKERFRSKTLMCNHVVEELVMFGWEMQLLRRNEYCFFRYDFENGSIFTEKAPFLSMLKTIIRKGKRCYHFTEDIDVELYSKYFINILSQMDFLESEHSQIMGYVLSPLLTERGKELLDDMEI